jgi:hypothetical protein
VAGGIEAFCQTVRAGLATASFAQRRLLVELLIDRVVVTNDKVEIRYVLPTSPDGPHPSFCQLRKDHLDAPAQLAEADQLHHRDIVREARQPVLDRLGLAGRPFDQQPTHGQLPPSAVGTCGGLAAWVPPAGRTRRARKRERCRPLLPRRQISSMPACGPAAKASWVSEGGRSRYRGRGRRPRPGVRRRGRVHLLGVGRGVRLDLYHIADLAIIQPWRNSPTSP